MAASEGALAAVDDVLEAEARLLFADGGRMPPTDYTKPDSSAAASAGIPPSLLRVHDSVALEVEIRSSIKLREEYLARLTALCGPDVSPTDLQQNLLDTIGVLDLMRNITVEIVESITRWRRGLPRPFPWQGSQAAKTSYLMKISNDTKFLAQQPALEGWLGMSLGHNPFFTLNVKCRQQAQKNVALRAETRVRAEASTHPLPANSSGLIPRGSPASCRGCNSPRGNPQRHGAPGRDRRRAH